jgi:hypothetical protein
VYIGSTPGVEPKPYHPLLAFETEWSILIGAIADDPSCSLSDGIGQSCSVPQSGLKPHHNDGASPLFAPHHFPVDALHEMSLSTCQQVLVHVENALQ